MRSFLPERNEQTLHGFSIVSYHVTLIFQSLYGVQWTCMVYYVVQIVHNKNLKAIKKLLLIFLYNLFIQF